MKRRRGRTCPRLPQLGSQSAHSRARLQAHFLFVRSYGIVMRWLARLPACLPAWGGYICNSTNITQATNEFLKSTIKGEAAPAAHIALALASLLTRAIFQAVVLLSPKYFPLKVAFHQHRALGAGIWRTSTKEGERRENSHLQSHVCASTKYIPVFTPPATNWLYNHGECHYL